MTHPTWMPLLKALFNTPEMAKLSQHIKQVRETKTIYPSSEKVLRAFELGVQDIRVVVIGQEPYPHEAADGFAFSSGSGFVPESLARIFDVLEQDLGFVLDQDPDLQRWADQGVFLYNTLLTVEIGKPLSHMNLGWEKFSTHVIKYLNDNTSNTVWMLWGKHSQVFKPLIDPIKHKVIETEHPIAGKYQQGRIWNHKNCFIECNNYLELYGKQPISWGVPT